MEKGFYKKESDVAEELTSTKHKEMDCESCGLYEKCKNGKVGVIGKGKKGILIIGEHPTKKEDDLNTPLNTKPYDYLRDVLKLNDISLEEDCWFVYAIRCRVPYVKGKKMVPAPAFTVCRQYLLNDIERLKPKSIITLGSDSLKTLIGHRTVGRANFTPFEKWIGWEIPDQELGCYIYPLNSPRYVLEMYDHPVIERRFIEGMEVAVKSKPFYIHNYESDVCVILDEDEAIKTLEMLMTKDALAFDYETTGLKPHREGHRILCVSFSDGFYGWSFPIFDSVEFHKALMKVLRSKRIKKIIHNKKFERTWTKRILNYEVNNIEFDTMIGAHVLDNRKKTSNLKLQTYVNFGVLGYDDDVDKYMNAVKEGEDKKSGNRFNRLDECPIDELCTYCGLDSLFTFKLYETQVAKLNRTPVLWEGYKLLHDADDAFCDVEYTGVKVNMGTVDKNIEALTSKMEELHELIMSDPSVAKWDGEDEFNYNSSQQLSHLLFDILGYVPKKLTAKEQASTDKEALEDIPEQFVKYMLERKKLDKLKTTYLYGFKREAVDNIIHPSFSVSGAQSYRTSSNSPNLQNLAAHDKFATEMVLSCIEAKNDRIIAVDEKSLEVMIGACYHHDPKMIEFLSDETSDMHKTVSAKVFMCSEEEVTEHMRRVGKTINFASQYGSSYYNIAVNSWEKLFTKDMKLFVRKRGIRNLPQWINHMKDVMSWYWEELFSEYGKWREVNWNNYLENGYTSLQTGLRCTDIMRYTQANNFLIQGAAANLVCFALKNINDYIKEHKLKSRIILYIHDSIEFDVVDSEWENELKDVVHYWMTKGISDNFPWVIAPLALEAEYYGENFNTKVSVEKLKMWVDKKVA